MAGPVIDSGGTYKLRLTAGPIALPATYPAAGIVLDERDELTSLDFMAVTVDQPGGVVTLTGVTANTPSPGQCRIRLYTVVGQVPHELVAGTPLAGLALSYFGVGRPA